MKIRKRPNYSRSLSQQNSKFVLVPVLTVVEDIRVGSQSMGRDRDNISGKVYCTSGIPDDQGFLLNDHDMDPGGTLGLFVPATAHVGLCSPLRWRQTIRSEAVWPVAMLGGEGGGVTGDRKGKSQRPHPWPANESVAAKYANSSHIRAL